LTPELTIGVGAQIEFFSIRLTHGAFTSLVLGNVTPSREYNADDWSVGATAGVLWQPSRATSIGLGYRSAVNLDVKGDYTRSAFTSISPGPPMAVPGVSTDAKTSLTLPYATTGIAWHDRMAELESRSECHRHKSGMRREWGLRSSQSELSGRMVLFCWSGVCV
jgi:hypothetical protein